MTALDIVAIRARAEKATPGPWNLEPENRQAVWYIGTKRPRTRLELKVEGADSRPTAAFIAAARTDVPALCDEVERLRKRLASCWCCET